MKYLKNVKYLLFVIIVVVQICGVSVFSQSKPTFKDGDRVCFIGNSITQDGRYHMLLNTFCVTRFPDEYVEFYSCGISGDVAYGMINRLDEDVLALQPDYAFLMTGMNDIQRYLYGKDITVDSAMLAKRANILKNYQSLTGEIVQSLNEDGVSPVLMTPSIYDQTAKIKAGNNFGANDALKQCAVHVRNMAKEYQAPLVDLNPAMIAVNKEWQTKDSTFTIVGHDRIHPGDEGHFVMAYHIIKSLTPSKYVSQIHIDRKRNTVHSQNCEVQLTKDNKRLKFSVTQNALPFPLHERFKKALDYVPFQKEFNQELLIVENLKKGKYQLEIDDIVVGKFTKEQLALGVNLADFSMTPQYQQALEVFSLCEEYHKTNGLIRNIKLVEYRMLNKYEGPNTIEGKRAYLDAELEKQKGKSWYHYNVKTVNSYFEQLPHEQKLWRDLRKIRKNIYESNQPKQHLYQLSKVED